MMPPSPNGRPDHYVDDSIQEDDVEKVISHASSLPSLATSSSPTAVSPSSSSSNTLPKALTLLGSTVILFCSFGLMNAFGAFQAWYATHQLLGMTSGNISWIGGLQLFVFFFSGYPVGRLYDAYGPRWLMLAGTTALSTSLLLLGACRAYWHLLVVQGALFGFGVGLLFYPSLTSLSTQFSTFRGTALGLAVAGSGLGGVIHPIILHALFNDGSIGGFVGGTRIMAAITGIPCLLGVICISTACKQTDCHAPNSAKDKDTQHATITRIFTLPFTLLVLGNAFVALGLFVPYFYIVQFASTQISQMDVNHFPPHYLLSLLNTGSTLGRLLLPALSDMRPLSRFGVIVPSSALAGLSTILWALCHTTQQTAVYVSLYGFFSGGFIGLVTPCIAQMTLPDCGILGRRIGALYTLVAFPSLVGPPLAGVILDKANDSSSSSSLGMRTRGWQALGGFSGGVVLCGAFLLAFSWRMAAVVRR